MITFYKRKNFPFKISPIFLVVFLTGIFMFAMFLFPSNYSTPVNLNINNASKLFAGEIAPTPTPAPTLFPEKYICLTFDDGPRESTTNEILNTLAKYKAKATFFVLGQNVKKNQKALRREIREGHEVGIHSYNHKKFSRLKSSQIKKQNSRTIKAIKKVANGYIPELIRPPYGYYSKRIAKACNMPMVLWNIDSLDWYNRKTGKNNKTVSKIIRSASPGSIVILHDIHEQTAQLLDKTLNELSKQGYSFITVSEMIRHKNNIDTAAPIPKNKVYFSSAFSKTIYKINTKKKK